MTNSEKAANLISRIKEYFLAEKPSGLIILNHYSKITDAAAYVEKNIEVMKMSNPFDRQFHACYDRLKELKAYIEKTKEK